MRLEVSIRDRIGIANAAVLPVPVCARPDDVGARHHRRDRRGLDGRRRLVADVGEGLQHRRVNLQVSKGEFRARRVGFFRRHRGCSLRVVPARAATMAPEPVRWPTVRVPVRCRSSVRGSGRGGGARRLRGERFDGVQDARSPRSPPAPTAPPAPGPDGGLRPGADARGRRPVRGQPRRARDRQGGLGAAARPAQRPAVEPRTAGGQLQRVRAAVGDRHQGQHQRRQPEHPRRAVPPRQGHPHRRARHLRLQRHRRVRHHRRHDRADVPQRHQRAQERGPVPLERQRRRADRQHAARFLGGPGCRGPDLQWRACSSDR